MPNSRSPFRLILIALVVTALFTSCSVAARKARHFSRGEKYLKAGDYEKAKLEFTNAIHIDPQSPDSFERMGAIWTEQGAPMRAGPYLARARELAPGDMPNRLNLARLYMIMGALPEARKEAETVFQQAPTNADALRLIVEASRTPQEFADAQQKLQQFPSKNNSTYLIAEATLALKRADVDTGEKFLAEALRLDPKAASAHTAMAAVQLMKRDVQKAGAEFKAAADDSPMRSTERIQYAEFQAQTGAAAEAIASLKAITAQAPDYLPAWRLLGQIAFSQKHYDEALSLLENVFSHDPDNTDSRMVQAQVLVAKGAGPQAVEVLQRLDKAYPKVASIKLQLARAYLLSNNTADAVAALNDALALEPENVDAKLLLAEVNLRGGDAQSVIDEATDILKKRPGLNRAELLLADAYRLQGRLDDAAGVFRDQIKASPTNTNAYLALGIILRQQQKNADARAMFEKVLELTPAQPFAVDQLVDMDLADKAFDVALKRAQAQVSASADSAAARVLEGKVYAAQQQWDQAEASFKAALEKDPGYLAAYNPLIDAYMAANQLPQAAEQIEQLQAKNSATPAGLMQLGLIYEKLGEFAKAAGTYEKLIALKPDFGAALNNLAYLYAEKLNQIDKAAETGRKARALQPGDPAIADTLGWVFYRQGDYPQSLSLLQESVSKLADNPEVQYHFGSAAYMMGQEEIARNAYQKAVAGPTDFPGKDEARRRLALLGAGSAAGNELSLSDLESLVKKEPNDVIGLTRLGDAYQKQGNNEKAAAAYENALRINPKLPSPTIKLALLYAGPLHDTAKGLDLAKKAREMAPNDIKVTGIIGQLAYDSGNFTWSYSLLQEAARQAPADAAAQYHYGWAAYSLGKLKDAREAMSRSLEISPTAPSATDAKVFLELTSGDSQANAVQTNDLATKRLQEDAKYVPALMVQAFAAKQRNETKIAEELYRRALERFPDFAPAQKDLAAIYCLDPAKVDLAYDLASKARKTLPDDRELARTMGIVSYQKKEFSRAVQLLQGWKKDAPNDADALYYLGMSQIAVGHKSDGVAEIKQALAAGLKNPLMAEAQKALSGGEQAK